MSRLPLSVIGGYLGAGKTTLINAILSGDHGLRIAVLVNDFGAINIDAALLKSADEDTIELTNGCVCCTMSGDLFYAIGDMLDRAPRPDHVVVEASGIADPAKIATLAQAEPDLRYGGILTVVDGLNFPRYLADPLICDQVRAQVTCADIVAVSKSATDAPEIAAGLTEIGVTHWLSASDHDMVAAALFGDVDVAAPEIQTSDHHPAYVQWAARDLDPMSRSQIQALMATLPKGVLRCKAIIPDNDTQSWEVHRVGQTLDISARARSSTSGIVVIGPQGAVTKDEIATWWAARPYSVFELT